MIAEFITGGLFGAITPLVNRGIAFFEKREEHKRTIQLEEIRGRQKLADQAHELTLHDLNIKAAKAETEREILVMRADIDKMDAKGSWAGLNRSIDDNTQVTLQASQWVIDSQAMTRPILTVLSMVIILLVFLMTPNARVDIAAGLLGMAIGINYWWFGDRGKKYDVNIPRGQEK